MKATALAMAAAGVILLIAVLPAEYGIDHTGLGGKLGLMKLSGSGGAAVTAAPPEAKPVAVEPVSQRPAPFRRDSLSLTLPPGKGAEIKATMQAGDTMVFSWVADGGSVNFDMHGEPPNAGNSFTSYWKDKDKTSGHGAFVAPFMGTHGWYWGNRGTAPVTVTVTTSGYYDEISHK